MEENSKDFNHQGRCPVKLYKKSEVAYNMRCNLGVIACLRLDFSVSFSSSPYWHNKHCLRWFVTRISGIFDLTADQVCLVFFVKSVKNFKNTSLKLNITENNFHSRTEYQWINSWTMVSLVLLWYVFFLLVAFLSLKSQFLKPK